MLDARFAIATASLATISRAPWGATNFKGEIVTAESPIDLDADRVQAIERHDGMLVVDVVITAPRAVRMLLIDDRLAGETTDA